MTKEFPDNEYIIIELLNRNLETNGRFNNIDDAVKRANEMLLAKCKEYGKTLTDFDDEDYEMANKENKNAWLNAFGFEWDTFILEI